MESSWSHEGTTGGRETRGKARGVTLPREAVMVRFGDGGRTEIQPRNRLAIRLDAMEETEEGGVSGLESHVEGDAVVMIALAANNIVFVVAFYQAPAYRA